jgi:hypothetical protein
MRQKHIMSAGMKQPDAICRFDLPRGILNAAHGMAAQEEEKANA